MPRRKQSNPQPVKLGVPDGDYGPMAVDPSCLVLDSDFLLSGELEFGDSEIMGLDRDTGVTVFSLSVEDSPSDPALMACVSCTRCGKLIGDSPLTAGLDLGVGLDLSSDIYCLNCEESLLSPPQSPKQSTKTSRKRRSQPKFTKITTIPSSKVFSCSLCSFTSHYSNHLKRHMRIHDNQKPFQCGLCAYASTQLVNLQRHARTHTGEKPYRCERCEYACTSHGNLRRHQRTHSEEERKKNVEKQQRKEKKKKKKRKEEVTEEVVSNLSVTVSQAGFLQSLGSLAPPGSPLPALLFPVCCRSCGHSLDDEDIQGGDTEGQLCRLCSAPDSPPVSPPVSRRRTRTLTLNLHRCPVCPFASHYQHHLNRHLQTHSLTKPHQCPHCPYLSSHLDNLKRHLRVHTGEKPYSCSTCSYACGNLANLRRHERVHTGSKPFHCHVCGYSCNQSMNLKRHMLRHTGHKPYACRDCDYTTGHWDNYKRHQRKHGRNTDNWDKRSYRAQKEVSSQENEC